MGEVGIWESMVNLEDFRVVRDRTSGRMWYSKKCTNDVGDGLFEFQRTSWFS